MESARGGGERPPTWGRRPGIAPPVTSSSPAIRRNSVVLPQPDGPTKTTKAPFSISRLASLMMLTGPNDLRTLCSVIWPMISALSPGLLDGAERKAADELPLRAPSEDDDPANRERRCRRQFCPEHALGT